VARDESPLVLAPSPGRASFRPAEHSAEEAAALLVAGLGLFLGLVAGRKERRLLGRRVALAMLVMKAWIACSSAFACDCSALTSSAIVFRPVSHSAAFASPAFAAA
jgi:hypothetical protein